MKKLMIAAAAAAMIGGVEASTVHIAQVYNYKMTVKTTICKNNKGTLTDKMGNSYVLYRNQTSYTFEGMFWGCGCSVIAKPVQEQYAQPKLNKGALSTLTCDDNNNSYVFWGKEDAFADAEFKWELLQLVGKKHENIEGVYTLKLFTRDSEGEIMTDAAADLRGAGYGTASINAMVYDEEDEEYKINPLNYIKSMNGYIVGYFNVVNLSGVIGCAYCGEVVGCDPILFCNCNCDDVKVSKDKSAIFGSWSIKYNSGLSKKVSDGKWITDAYKFKDYVKAEFVAHTIE